MHCVQLEAPLRENVLFAQGVHLSSPPSENVSRGQSSSPPLFELGFFPGFAAVQKEASFEEYFPSLQTVHPDPSLENVPARQLVHRESPKRLHCLRLSVASQHKDVDFKG